MMRAKVSPAEGKLSQSERQSLDICIKPLATRRPRFTAAELAALRKGVAEHNERWRAAVEPYLPSYRARTSVRQRVASELSKALEAQR